MKIVLKTLYILLFLWAMFAQPENGSFVVAIALGAGLGVGINELASTLERQALDLKCLKNIEQKKTSHEPY